MGLSSKHVSGDHQPGFEWVPQPELSKPPSARRHPPPHQQSEHLKCPRCNSDKTKFCYYNNYNKSQPRHFCKSCKRHWTKGGTLRNVPVGGGRKNKRPKISKPATATPTPTVPRKQELSEFPLKGNSSSTGAQKSMTTITTNTLYQALLHETTKSFNTASSVSVSGLNASSPHHNITPSEFHFSSLNTFDMNVSWDPACYQPLNAFDHHYGGNLDSIEESTITTVNIPSSSSGPWAGPDSSSTLDLPNYWNWSDIDVLNTADLNLSWDDEDDGGNAETKAQNKFQD